jgi:hypothetical protein
MEVELVYAAGPANGMSVLKNDAPPYGPLLSGKTTCSLSHSSVSDDSSNTKRGFFHFSDLKVPIEGTFRLRFTLANIEATFVSIVHVMESASFNVVKARNYNGKAVSTQLAKDLAANGNRIKLHKEVGGKKSPNQASSQDDVDDNDGEE